MSTINILCCCARLEFDLSISQPVIHKILLKLQKAEQVLPNTVYCLNHGSFCAKSYKLDKLSEISCSPINTSSHPQSCDWNLGENEGARTFS